MDIGNKKRLAGTGIQLSFLRNCALSWDWKTSHLIMSFLALHIAHQCTLVKLHPGNWVQYQPEPFVNGKFLLLTETQFIFFNSISHSIPPKDKQNEYGAWMTTLAPPSALVFRSKISILSLKYLTQLIQVSSVAMKTYDWPTKEKKINLKNIFLCIFLSLLTNGPSTAKDCCLHFVFDCSA